MQTLLIECGIAQTRAALLHDDAVWKFWFGPARGDETEDAFPLAGRRFAGRVRRVDHALGAAFVDIGAREQAFLPIRKNFAADCVEGAMLEVSIKTPPRQQKGALTRFVNVIADRTEPSRLAPFADPVIEAAQALAAHADEIIVDDGASRRLLDEAGFQDAIHAHEPTPLFARYGAAAQLAAAFDGTVWLPGGGALFIDEAQALTAIDVDTGGLGAASPARLREKIAYAAAEEAIRQIAMRNIGGHVVIDFPAIASDRARKKFADHLYAAMKRLDGAGAMSFTKSGLFSFTMPQSALSLLDQFTQTGSVAPVMGRRFTQTASARAAIRALEDRLREEPSVRLRLALSEGLAAVVNNAPQWSERLAARYGARVVISQSNQCEGQSFDISEQ